MTAVSSDPGAASSEGLPKAGDIIADKYELENEIGRGGMGVVFAARHLTLRQRVAIKFLAAEEMDHLEAAARFLREARAAASIQSDHVARTLDFGTLDGGVLYMVMEHLAGQNLNQVIRKYGRLEPRATVDYVLEACEAIAEAHALGIVHRDLKPANLFLASKPDGSVVLKVLDFGLSKLTVDESDHDYSLTGVDRLMGSPYYMSPEQLRSAKDVDARTDIWALGTILYHALTGVRPFTGESLPAICACIAADAPEPVRKHRSEIPVALEMIVRRCLQKEVGKRYPSIQELVKALRPHASLAGQQSAERTLKLDVEAIRAAAVESTGRHSALDDGRPISQSGSGDARARESLPRSASVPREAPGPEAEESVVTRHSDSGGSSARPEASDGRRDAAVALSPADAPPASAEPPAQHRLATPASITSVVSAPAAPTERKTAPRLALAGTLLAVAAVAVVLLARSGAAPSEAPAASAPTADTRPAATPAAPAAPTSAPTTAAATATAQPTVPVPSASASPALPAPPAASFWMGPRLVASSKPQRSVDPLDQWKPR